MILDILGPSCLKVIAGLWSAMAIPTEPAARFAFLNRPGQRFGVHAVLHAGHIFIPLHNLLTQSGLTPFTEAPGLQGLAWRFCLIDAYLLTVCWTLQPMLKTQALHRAARTLENIALTPPGTSTRPTQASLRTRAKRLADDASLAHPMFHGRDLARPWYFRGLVAGHGGLDLLPEFLSVQGPLCRATLRRRRTSQSS